MIKPKMSIVYATVGAKEEKGGVTRSSSEVARDIAEHLIQNKLAICVNIADPHNAVYWYEGHVECDSGEVLMSIKTITAKRSEVIKGVVEHHPYDTPVVWSMDVAEINDEAAEWVNDFFNTEVNDAL